MAYNERVMRRYIAGRKLAEAVIYLSKEVRYYGLDALREARLDCLPGDAGAVGVLVAVLNDMADQCVHLGQTLLAMEVQRELPLDDKPKRKRKKKGGDK